MADVARQAGVSHQTVSRVLNGHPNVSPGTRASVLAAIRDLGYRPNAAARTLVTGRTNVLGVYAPNPVVNTVQVSSTSNDTNPSNDVAQSDTCIVFPEQTPVCSPLDPA